MSNPNQNSALDTLEGRTDLPFIALVDGQVDLFLRAQDGAITRLTNDSATEADPALSPSGEQIAFSSDRDGDPDLYLLSSTGGRPKRLTNLAGAEASPSWSPDEQGLVFVHGRATDNEDLYIVAANGSAPQPITRLGGITDSPSWSPDGKWIAFDHWDGGHDIYLTRPDGSGLRNLTKSGNVNHGAPPVWAPDSKTLAVNAYTRLEHECPDYYASCPLATIGNVKLVSVTTGEARNIVEENLEHIAVGWQDESVILGQSSETGAYRLIEADLESGKTKILRNEPPLPCCLGWGTDDVFQMSQ